MNSYKIFASGLGLVIGATDALAGLVPNRDYLSEKDEYLEEKFRSQSIFLLNTGSPELDYKIIVYEESDLPIRTTIEDEIEVGLLVTGRSVSVRDGYDLMNWDPQESSAILIPCNEGYYHVKIGWSRSQNHSEMILHLIFLMKPEKMQYSEMVELFYREAP